MSHPNEPHEGTEGSRLNSLRAAVLGANDGIVSVSALILGVIGSGAGAAAIFTAGLASTIAGAVSMSLGEYVSVSAQRDTERAQVEQERRELAEDPAGEHLELAEILEGYGMTKETAHTAAAEIGRGDTLSAHLRLELGLDDDDLTSPWQAAGWSALSFLSGALLPLLSVFVAPRGNEALLVTAVTLVALSITGFISAKLSRTSPVVSVARLVIGGALGLAVTYGIGSLFGVATG